MLLRARRHLTSPPRAAFALLLILAGCERPTLAGSWTGRDPDGTTVLYVFTSGGTGYRVIGGERAPLRYQVAPGYPNRLRIEVGEGEAAVVRHGLVELLRNDRMRLELGPPGGPAPEQLTDRALELRRPATR